MRPNHKLTNTDIPHSTSQWFVTCKQDDCFYPNRNIIPILKSTPKHLPLLTPVARKPKLTTPLPPDPVPAAVAQLYCKFSQHPLLHSNFTKQNRVKMWFRILTPTYLFFMGSSAVNLNPPVHPLIWNTFHEPVRSSAQVTATVKKLDGEKQSKIWGCSGALLHP